MLINRIKVDNTFDTCAACDNVVNFSDFNILTIHHHIYVKCCFFSIIFFTSLIIECPVGYRWINSSLECPYPLYGKMCQQECLCNKNQCEFVNGCRDGSVFFLKKWKTFSSTCIYDYII